MLKGLFLLALVATVEGGLELVKSTTVVIDEEATSSTLEVALFEKQDDHEVVSADVLVQEIRWQFAARLKAVAAACHEDIRDLCGIDLKQRDPSSEEAVWDSQSVRGSHHGCPMMRKAHTCIKRHYGVDLSSQCELAADSFAEFRRSFGEGVMAEYDDGNHVHVGRVLHIAVWGGMLLGLLCCSLLCIRACCRRSRQLVHQGSYSRVQPSAPEMPCPAMVKCPSCDKILRVPEMTQVFRCPCGQLQRAPDTCNNSKACQAVPALTVVQGRVMSVADGGGCADVVSVNATVVREDTLASDPRDDVPVLGLPLQ